MEPIDNNSDQFSETSVLTMRFVLYLTLILVLTILLFAGMRL